MDKNITARYKDSHTIHKVREFHKVFHHPVEVAPTVPSPATRLLRFKLIFEELLEFGRAIGVEGLAGIPQEEFEQHVRTALGGVVLDETLATDLVEAADALGDLDYVVQGANLAFGFPAEAVVANIHESNMSKLGADGQPILAPGGKVVKGPNYHKPDIASVLANHS